MKKVLHISSYYPPHLGGVEQVAADIVDALKDSFEQVIIAFNHEKGDKEEKNGNITIYRCNCQTKISSQAIALKYGKKLKKIVNEFNPDIIHFHFPNPFAAHYLLKLKTKAKLIVHYHSDIIKQKILRLFFKKQTERLLRKADIILATSPQYIEKSAFLPDFKEKCILVPNCLNENRLLLTEEDIRLADTLRKRYQNKIIGLFVGRHVPYKGLKYLIEAAPMLSKEVVLLIAGEGVLTDTLKKQASGKNNVAFVGPLRKELKGYLYACDIFTFPSITKNEAFGIALAEAMWYSKPAVTFYIEGSGVNYVGLKDITCLECENGNVQQLAEAINRLAGDAALRKFLGDNARKRAEELFTHKKFCCNILNVYERILQ